MTIQLPSSSVIPVALRHYPQTQPSILGKTVVSPNEAREVIKALYYYRRVSVKDDIQAVVDEIYQKIRLVEPETPLSVCVKAAIDSTPSTNNRQDYRLRYHLYGDRFEPELKPLDDLLCKRQPTNFNSTTREHRDATISQVRAVNPLMKVQQLADDFGTPYVLHFIEMLAFLPSAATLFWVHKALGGVSLMRIGTQKHWDKYLADSDSLKVVWCCLMTEVLHGTNVKGLETTATFDKKTRKFVINTPHEIRTDEKGESYRVETGAKIWPGGAAEHATHGICFAKLIIDGKNYGVHAFVVPMRVDGKLVPGVKVEDLGRKNGLNGVDNGVLWFDNLEIPYDNLLDHYCDIDAHGMYISKNGNRNPQNLIYKLMMQFVYGRRIITLASTAALKFCSTLMYVYPPQSLPEASYKRKLASTISKAYALELAKPLYVKNPDHVISSMMKAISSDLAIKTFMELEDLYGAASELEIRKMLHNVHEDADATTTYEGVNVVLKQLGAQDFLKNVSKNLMQSVINAAKVYYLGRGQPINLLLREVYKRTYRIYTGMKPYKTDDEKLKVWGDKFQHYGAEMGVMHTQSKIMANYFNAAKELDKKEPTPFWSSLATIYAWETTAELLHIPLPDLEEHYARVEPRIPQLTAKFGMKLEWLDSIITPPDDRPRARL